MLKEKPTGITADREAARMTVTWADAHTSIYPFYLLRAACPCAQCRGGHENMRSEPGADVFDSPPDDSPRTHLNNVLPTGSYGITIVWEDGHDYGIYNWHYLRALCPCPVCRGEAGHAGSAPESI